MHPSSRAYIVCEVQDPFRPDPAPGEPLSHALYELFLLTLPVQIIGVGIAFSRYARRWRPFALSLVIALFVLLLPWATLLALGSRAASGVMRVE
jgi:hypothetical protein